MYLLDWAFSTLMSEGEEAFPLKRASVWMPGDYNQQFLYPLGVHLSIFNQALFMFISDLCSLCTVRTWFYLFPYEFCMASASPRTSLSTALALRENVLYFGKLQHCLRRRKSQADRLNLDCSRGRRPRKCSSRLQCRPKLNFFHLGTDSHTPQSRSILKKI